ncbi:hypothetical protein IFT68_04115 [Oxalobacteraceae sp. CFBP 13730]|nr:hypothetical protein [Oxalobacteraceae sp. CFBP 13730]
MPPAQISRTDRDNTVSTIMSIFPGKTCKADVARSDVIGFATANSSGVFLLLGNKNISKKAVSTYKVLTNQKYNCALTSLYKYAFWC